MADYPGLPNWGYGANIGVDLKDILGLLPNSQQQNLNLAQIERLKAESGHTRQLTDVLAQKTPAEIQELLARVGLLDAQRAGIEADTREVPANAASKRALEGAQGGQIQEQTRWIGPQAQADIGYKGAQQANVQQRTPNEVALLGAQAGEAQARGEQIRQLTPEQVKQLAAVTQFQIAQTNTENAMREPTVGLTNARADESMANAAATDTLAPVQAYQGIANGMRAINASEEETFNQLLEMSKQLQFLPMQGADPNATVVRDEMLRRQGLQPQRTPSTRTSGVTDADIQRFGQVAGQGTAAPQAPATTFSVLEKALGSGWLPRLYKELLGGVGTPPTGAQPAPQPQAQSTRSVPRQAQPTATNAPPNNMKALIRLLTPEGYLLPGRPQQAGGDYEAIMEVLRSKLRGGTQSTNRTEGVR